MSLYDYDEMSVPPCRRSHQLIFCADHMIRCNRIVWKSYAHKVPNRVSGAPRGIKGKPSEESDAGGPSVWSVLV